ncbi:hypothetical protein LZ32DRAFT_373762 [Colletotrichum eremochloae]|nr:hypothetical protein LZ32DRAFT_373762 [Colletotrichum eremochloae]
MCHPHVPEPKVQGPDKLFFFPLPSLLRRSQAHPTRYPKLCNSSACATKIVSHLVEIPETGEVCLGGQLPSALRDQPGSSRHSAAGAQMAECYYTHPSTPFTTLSNQQKLSGKHARARNRRGRTGFLGRVVRLSWPQAPGTNPCGFERAECLL